MFYINTDLFFSGYQAVLSNAESRISTMRPVSSMGSAVFFLQQNGNVNYQVLHHINLRPFYYNYPYAIKQSFQRTLNYYQSKYGFIKKKLFNRNISCLLYIFTTILSHIVLMYPVCCSQRLTR